MYSQGNGDYAVQAALRSFGLTVDLLDDLSIQLILWEDGR